VDPFLCRHSPSQAQAVSLLSFSDHTQLEPHTHAHVRAVCLLWTSDQLVAEVATYTTDEHHNPQRDSNPGTQHTGDRRPTPHTALPHATDQPNPCYAYDLATDRWRCSRYTIPRLCSYVSFEINTNVIAPRNSRLKERVETLTENLSYNRIGARLRLWCVACMKRKPHPTPFPLIPSWLYTLRNALLICHFSHTHTTLRAVPYSEIVQVAETSTV